MDEKKRQIPRHVDGRFKIGEIITLKNFLILLIIDIPLIIAVFKLIIRFRHPIVFFVGFSIIGFISMLFLEFKFRETGLDIIKDTISSLLKGNIYTERGMMK